MSNYTLRRAIKGIKAEMVAAELSRIHDENGGLTPAIVVAEAEPEGAPLHPAFEWDDTAAARAYRLWQARVLILNVRVVQDDSERDLPIYAHVTIDHDDDVAEGRYVAIADLAPSGTLARQAYQTMVSRIASAKRAVDDFREALKAPDRSRIELMNTVTTALNRAENAATELAL